MSKTFMIANLLMLALTSAACAAVMSFTSKAQWEAAVGPYSTIGFTEVTPFSFVTTQYQHLGILFTDENDVAQCCSFETYPEDGAGLDGNGDIRLSFSVAQYSIASSFPGFIRFQLYWRGSLTYTSGLFGHSGYGNFGGLMSSTPFDSATIHSDFGQAHIDDLYFGPPIPGPATTMSLLVLAASVRHRRRRS